MSNMIFVLDTNLKPLTPCKPSMAHKLLTAGKAAVFRRFPFTISALELVQGISYKYCQTVHHKDGYSYVC